MRKQRKAVHSSRKRRRIIERRQRIKRRRAVFRRNIIKNLEVERKLAGKLIFSSEKEKKHWLKKREEFNSVVREVSLKTLKEGFKVEGRLPFVVFTDFKQITSIVREIIKKNPFLLKRNPLIKALFELSTGKKPSKETEEIIREFELSQENAGEVFFNKPFPNADFAMVLIKGSPSKKELEGVAEWLLRPFKESPVGKRVSKEMSKL
jgi:hypothetical protein